VLQPLPLPQVGQAIGGKYLVERTLGEGGMGVVFEVRHAQLGQRFAVKLLRPEIVRDSEAVARFNREARAAASLTSRHVCRVTDVGAREDGTPYMVMECLEGEDLGALLERHGPLPLGDVARYLLEACEAMEEAHARGIVHRDLKPENLFLARVGSSTSVKVLDFGISKRAEDDAVNVTRTQSSLGTPLYMSPEQTRSTKHVDARTDIWSMGVILYELLSGEVPFKGETPGQVAVSVAVDKVVPLRSYRPELPEAIENVIAGALAKDASDRYPTIRAFAAALTPFAVGIDTSHWSRPPPPMNATHAPLDRTGSKPSLETATTLHVQTTQQSKASGRLLWLGGAALAAPSQRAAEHHTGAEQQRDRGGSRPDERARHHAQQHRLGHVVQGRAAHQDRRQGHADRDRQARASEDGPDGRAATDPPLTCTANDREHCVFVGPSAPLFGARVRARAASVAPASRRR
jgi:serine/threonine protein kinase